MTAPARFICLCMAVSMALVGGTPTGATVALQPFTVLKDSLPFAGEVALGPNDTVYDITLTGPPEAAAALKATVKKNTTLELKLKSKLLPKGFNTTSLSYLIRMPEGRLAQFKQSGAGASLVDGAVVNTTHFTVSATGAANCSVANVTSKLVNATLTGVGTLEVNASTQGTGIDELAFSGVGAGSAWVRGVSKAVDVSLAGVSSVYVTGGSDSLVITGTVVGMSTVYFDAGHCNVTSPFPFHPACVQQPAAEVAKA